ncbi:MAG TPA: MauE/DoxX family redox-associated membrane protein, partial [Syntrophobacteraceae bacterium]|nr:MauE/DoxX family redox-associated membrane protein [Syntrophobacteraceae bacterium]
MDSSTTNSSGTTGTSLQTRSSSASEVSFTVVRIFLGIVFFAASADKILHPAPFARIVYNYQILPSSLVNL